MSCVLNTKKIKEEKMFLKDSFKESIKTLHRTLNLSDFLVNYTKKVAKLNTTPNYRETGFKLLLKDTLQDR